MTGLRVRAAGRRIATTAARDVLAIWRIGNDRRVYRAVRRAGFRPGVFGCAGGLGFGEVVVKRGKTHSPETRAKMAEAKNPFLKGFTESQCADFRMFRRKGYSSAEARELVLTDV